MDERSTSSQDAHYRRGVVLGLTVGEAMLLLLFCLLLVLAVPLIQVTEKNNTLSVSVDETRATLASVEANASTLREMVRKYEQTLNGKTIDDITKEYVVMAQRLKELEGRVSAMQASTEAFRRLIEATGGGTGGPAQKSPIELANELAAELNADREVRDAVLDALGSDVVSQGPLAITEALRKIAADAQRGELNALDPNSLIERLAGKEGELKQALSQLSNTKGQLENLRQQFARGGRGVDAVPCWSTPAGKPEYIFDVALTSNGLIVRDRKLPHRQEEQQLLPLGDLAFETELTSARFLLVTRGIRDWSNQHECRFFVRAFDKTAVTEKAIYKRHLKSVEERFYKFEVLDEQF